MPRIMIVDDESSMRFSIEGSLASMGYHVIGQAESGEQAVKMARDLKPDLILMDIKMPGQMDGISAAEKIRSELDVAIVFLTGYANSEYVERAKRVEPFGYIMKPWTDEEIRASIEIAFYKKEMEGKLREKEETYRGLFENAPIGIGISDEEGNILDFNDAILHPGGYSREEVTKAGNLSEFYYDRNVRAEILKKAVEQGYVDEEEVQFKRKDGTPYDTLLSLRPIRLEGKSCWQAMVQDVTARKQAEEELQEARREWEGIFQVTGNPTLIMDVDHRLIHANAATEKATGRSEKDLIGKRCYEIFHNSHEPPEGCPFEKMIASGRLETVEMEVESLGGSFLVSCTPMLDEKGRIEKVIHIATDITDRRKGEEKLKETQRLLTEAERLGKVGGWEFDIDTEKLTWTESVRKIHEVDPTYHPTVKKAVDFYTPASRPIIEAALHRAVNHGEPFDVELEMVTAKGNLRSAHVIGKKDTERPRVYGFFQNVTETRSLQAQLLKSQKTEAIATLTGGIAHDYNNLLAIIMGNLSLARDETEPHSVMGEFLQEAEQASAKAKDLTHELMTLSRGGHPVKTTGSMAGLLKEIPEQVRSHEGIKIIFSIQDDLRPVAYDARQMGFAINNLLINAAEAMSRGGKITLQAENQVIVNPNKEFPSFLNGGPYVRISIKDEGVGIPEEHLDKIFDPYFSTKEQGTQKGMGLGLTTAYAVVQKHGGHMVVNSKTGVGTTVTIYLPAECAESKAPDAQGDDVGAQSTIADQQSAIRRILVMDDEESLRTLAQKMLERLGYEVETANDGVEAIQKYQRHMDSGEPFDAVLLDLTIKGGMGGDQAIKELIKIDPHVKAIVCSGYFNDSVMADYRGYGFRGAMEKPYQKADLDRVLKKVLG